MAQTIPTSSLQSGRITLGSVSRRRFVLSAAGVLIPASIKTSRPLSLASPAFVNGYATASGGGGSAPTFGAGATTAAANNDFSEAFSTSGSNRLLLVMVGGWRSGGWNCSGITYNGVAMTRWRKEDVSCELFYLVAPATGSNTVSASFSLAPVDSIMTMAYFNGVNQSTPLRAGSSAGGTGGVSSGAWTASSSISSATGDTVVIAYEWWRAFTVGAGQTSRITGMVASNEVGGTIATADGASSFTPTGTINNAVGGIVWIGASIQPV